MDKDLEVENDFEDIGRSYERHRKNKTDYSEMDKKELAKTLQPNSESIFQNIKGKILQKNTYIKTKPKTHPKK